jgi:hypothetical protein
MEACWAYAASQGYPESTCPLCCSDGWSCSSLDSYVCFSDPTGNTCENYCWGYESAYSEQGKLYSCACTCSHGYSPPNTHCSTGSSEGSWD